MLKHHYKTVPNKYFAAPVEEEESRYSQEFLSESQKKVKTQNDEDSDNYSDEAYDEEPKTDRASIEKDV